MAGQTLRRPCRQRPEYVSAKLMEWAENQGIALSIQPGKPQQNA
jgi:hypothetical protein